MNVVRAIVGRNLRLFFRDRMNVFFSLLGAIILFGLYTLFLGNLQTTDLAASLPGATEDEVQAFVDSWMFAGIVLITTVTTGLGGIAVLTDDGASGRFRDFLVSPVRRSQLVLGYLVSAAIVALVLSAVVFVLSLVYLGLVRGLWLSVPAVLTSAGIVVLSCLAFTALSAFVVSFVRTMGAFSALATIVGTVLGFVAAAYIPVGALPDAVASVVAALPFAQTGMLLRREFSGDALETITQGAPGAQQALRDVYGLDLYVGDWAVPPVFVVGALVALAIACTVLSAALIRRRIR